MTTIAETLDTTLDFVPRDEKRKEAKLVETKPYTWRIVHHYVDCDHLDLSFQFNYSIPGPCGIRKARWIAWELGFDTVNGKEVATQS